MCVVDLRSLIVAYSPAILFHQPNPYKVKITCRGQEYVNTLRQAAQSLHVEVEEMPDVTTQLR